MKAYDKAEDPIYALEHNLPIDFQHYLDHHLELPLERLFGPVMNNPKELMTGGNIPWKVTDPVTDLGILLSGKHSEPIRGCCLLRLCLMLCRRTHQEHCAGDALHTLRGHHALCQGAPRYSLFMAIRAWPWDMYEPPVG